MKILFIIREEPDETTRKIMEIQSQGNETVTIYIQSEMDYDRVVDEIVNSDKVISW